LLKYQVIHIHQCFIVQLQASLCSAMVVRNRTVGQQKFHNITTSTVFFSLWHTAQIRPRLPHCWGF